MSKTNSEHPLLSATHFCRDCRALWRQCDDFTFNLRSTQCCVKCDNTPCAEQLIPLTATPGWWHGEDSGAPFRLLVAACNRLSAEAEEFDFEDGMGRGALQSYWDEFELALERAQEVLR